MEVILTVGLPRSGKSTWSKKQGLPIVNRDAIRLAHHGKEFLPECEDFITVLETNMVKSLLGAGNEKIIIDATHISMRRRNRWKNILGKDVKVFYKYFGTSVDVCKERARISGKEHLLGIIDRMNKDLEPLHDSENEYYPTWLNMMSRILYKQLNGV